MARSIVESVQRNCVEEMCTVAAMLSSESIYYNSSLDNQQTGQQNSNGNTNNKQHGPSPETLLFDKYHCGDHTLLYFIYQRWKHTDFQFRFLKEHNLNAKTMKFVRDVRRQISDIVMRNMKSISSAFHGDRMSWTHDPYEMKG